MTVTATPPQVASLSGARPRGALLREPPRAAASIRRQVCQLARHVRSLRALAEVRTGRSLGDEMQRRLEEGVEELERAGTAYFEEHCGPHLGRLCDHEAVWG